MPPVGAAIATFAASATAASVGTFVTSLVGRMLVSVATSALIAALTAPDAAARQGGGISTSVTLSGSTNPASFIMGRYATGGVMVCPPMSHGEAGKTPNAYLTYVIGLSCVAGCSLVQLILDGEIVTLGGAAHADYGTPMQGRYNGYGWVKYYDGSQTAADPGLLAKYSSYPKRPWSADMIGRGLCYAIITMRYNPELWQGFPAWRFVLDGIPLYDPRKDTTAGGSGAHRWATPSTWEQTNNAFNLIHQVMRGITLPWGNVWGGGFAAARLPYASWAAAMNECARAVDNASGGTEAQFRAGFEVKVDRQPADIIGEFLKASSGRLAEIGGTWKARAGATGLPVYFMTDADGIVTQAEEYRPFPPLAQTFNGVSATYPEPASRWESKPAPPRYNATWEAEDGGRRLVADLALPAVPYPDQVQRLTKALAADNRKWRRHVRPLPPDAFVVEPLDTVSWTSTANGYTDKVFEVGAQTDDLLTVIQKLGLRETDPDDYSYPGTIWLPSAASAPGTNVPAAQTVPGFQVEALGIPGASGTPKIPGLRLRWNGDGQDDVTGLKWEIRLTATGVVVARGSTHDVTGGILDTTTGILKDTLYQARARFIVDRATVWTNWVDATEATPDLAITLPDLADEVQTLLAEAEIVRQEGQQLVADLRAEIDTEFAIEIPRVADVEQAISTIATQVTWLATLAAQTEKNVADAGLYIDPLTGKARLEGVARVEDKVNAVSVTLDAQAAQIALRVTQADVDLAIAAAQLDPTELPIITGLEGRVTDLEVSLDAAEAAILQRATVVDFDALGTEVSEATIRIDALEAEIVQKVETSDFTALESRVTTAEVTLSALDGAGLTIQVADIRQDLRLVDGLADMTLEQIANLHQEQLGRLADTALVRQEYSALVTDEREARASLRTELAAAIDANLATALQEIAVVASETDAQATLITQLTATVNANTAAITSEAIARATEDEALAGQLDSIEVTVAENTSAITIEQAVRASADSALSSSIASLTATVISNTAAITSEAAARASADSALSTTLSTVQATTNANTAAITNEAAARTNADSALATQINSVSATANATAATVSIQQSAIATLEGNAEASLVLRSRAGGASGEIEIVAADDPVSGPSSVVKIKSDRFQFIGDLAEFLGDVRITGDLIVDGAVSRRFYAKGNPTHVIPASGADVVALSKTGMGNRFVAYQGPAGDRSNPIMINLHLRLWVSPVPSSTVVLVVKTERLLSGVWDTVNIYEVAIQAGYQWAFHWSVADVEDGASLPSATGFRIVVYRSTFGGGTIELREASFILTQISV